MYQFRKNKMDDIWFSSSWEENQNMFLLKSLEK